MADLVEIILALRNVRQFVGEAHQAERAMHAVGETSEKAGTKASRGWKGVAKWAAGASVIYGAQRFIRGAVAANEDLARSTLGLQRVTSLDTETASEWAALAKERGISTRQLQMGIVKLSRAMETSRLGTSKENTEVARLRRQIDEVAAVGGKKAPAQIAKLSNAIASAEKSGIKSRKALDALGISAETIASGDTRRVLSDVADAFARMDNPATRAATAQQLFGRSGLVLLPILMKGSKGVDELLRKQKEYGNYIGGKGVDDVKRMIEEQRELEGRWTGTKVQLGQALLPVLIDVGAKLTTLSRIVGRLTKHATVFKIAIGGLTVALVAYKIAMIAATIATSVFEVAALPVVLVVLAIVAAVALLAAGFYFAYTRVGFFRDAMQATWRWIKTNWPYLVAALAGPFGIAALLIVRHFRAVKQFVLGVVRAIRHAFDVLVDYIEAIPRKIGGIAKRIPGVNLAQRALGALPLAEGGVVRRAGAFVVGERGPELLSLPSGAAVTPNSALALEGTSGPLRPIEIVVPVLLDNREIARSTARVAADTLARR